MALTAAEREYLRREIARKRAEGRVCPGCGGPVPVTQRGRTWCSRGCYNRNWHRIRKKELGQNRTKLSYSPYWDRGWPVAPCPICEQPIPFRDGKAVDHWPLNPEHAYSEQPGYFCRGSGSLIPRSDELPGG